MVDFVDRMVKTLSDHYGDGFQIEKVSVTKNNSTKLNGVVIKEHGYNACPTFYLNDAYESYKGGVSVEEIAESIVRTYDVQAGSFIFEPSELTNYEKIQNKIRCRLVNYELNEEYLQTVPHDKFLDLAVIYYISIDDDKSTIVTNDLMNIWSKEVGDLMLQSLHNNINYEPAVTRKMTDYISEDMCYIPDDMYIVTTKRNYYGSVCLVYGEPFHELATIHDSNLIIFPSSIHEVIVVPRDDFDADEMRDIVRNVNDTQVSHDEILSYNVYKYDKNSRDLLIL